MFHSLVLKIAAALIAIVAFFSPATPHLGNYNPSGGGTYRLNASVGTSDTSATLSSFKEPVSNIPFTMAYINTDIIYGTLDPQTSHSEFVAVTGVTQNSDGTATLSGLTRGLSRTPGNGGCVASTTLAQSHSGQSIFIMSNPPCQLGEYLPLRSNSTSTAIVTFASTTMPRYDGDPGSANFAASNQNVFVNYAQLARTALAGTVNASESVNGVVELATQLESASSTSIGGTAASLVLQSKYATSSPGSAGLWAVITNNAGKIAQAFLDLTQSYTWTGAHTFNATTTIAASSASTTALVLNTVAYQFPSSRAASGTVLAENGYGHLAWQAPDWKILVSSTTVGAQATTTVTGIPAASDLHVVVDTPAISGVIVLTLQFNGDTTAAYDWNKLTQGGTAASGATVGAIQLTQIAGAGANFYSGTIDITNTASRMKMVHSSFIQDASVANLGADTVWAAWDNTSNQINSISLGCGNGTNCPAGTRITVYGSNF